MNSVTVTTVVRAIVMTVARVAIVKNVRVVNVVTLAICSYTALKWAVNDGVEVRHIVGAIANEGDISSRYIGNIKLFASHSTIELPKGMPGEVLQHFTRTRILNKPMNMQLVG
ncbi:ATP-dependent RNA helicase DeaD [Salmonella enterica subsp. enterica]|uniref:ATP-dependent RNA helicase DeaD n=1 Tax=Salmonella enterica I TaxID=59201 RepID=A0A3S4JAE9_SALET|nr:ATP-dependent RNA helicase DeaD [Salmonella enterica subsp. enterica]